MRALNVVLWVALTSCARPDLMLFCPGNFEDPATPEDDDCSGDPEGAFAIPMGSGVQHIWGATLSSKHQGPADQEDAAFLWWSADLGGRSAEGGALFMAPVVEEGAAVALDAGDPWMHLTHHTHGGGLFATHQDYDDSMFAAVALGVRDQLDRQGVMVTRAVRSQGQLEPGPFSKEVLHLTQGPVAAPGSNHVVTRIYQAGKPGDPVGERERQASIACGGYGAMIGVATRWFGDPQRAHEQAVETCTVHLRRGEDEPALEFLLCNPADGPCEIADGTVNGPERTLDVVSTRPTHIYASKIVELPGPEWVMLDQGRLKYMQARPDQSLDSVGTTPLNTPVPTPIREVAAAWARPVEGPADPRTVEDLAVAVIDADGDAWLLLDDGQDVRPITTHAEMGQLVGVSVAATSGFFVVAVWSAEQIAVARFAR